MDELATRPATRSRLKPMIIGGLLWVLVGLGIGAALGAVEVTIAVALTVLWVLLSFGVYSGLGLMVRDLLSGQKRTVWAYCSGDEVVVVASLREVPVEGVSTARALVVSTGQDKRERTDPEMNRKLLIGMHRLIVVVSGLLGVSVLSAGAALWGMSPSAILVTALVALVMLVVWGMAAMFFVGMGTIVNQGVGWLVVVEGRVRVVWSEAEVPAGQVGTRVVVMFSECEEYEGAPAFK